MQAAPLQSVLVAPQASPRQASMAVSSDFRRVVSRWWLVARLWWRSSDRRRAWAFVAACITLSLSNVALLLWISYAQNALQTGLSEKNPGEKCPSAWCARPLARLPTCISPISHSGC